MNQRFWGLALASLLCTARPSMAEAPTANRPESLTGDELQAADWDAAHSSSLYSVQLQDEFVGANARGAGDREPSYYNGETEEGPEHIRDNAFLVEEAFNQEPGEVQHIFNWIHLWDRTASGRTRDFASTYTMELPLGSKCCNFPRS